MKRYYKVSLQKQGPEFGLVGSRTKWLTIMSLLAAAMLLVIASGTAKAQTPELTVTDFVDRNTPELLDEMVQNTLLADGDVTVSNVTYLGADSALATFSGGSGIVGFESGIILSSGSADGVVGPNVETSFSTRNTSAGDADLDALVADPNRTWLRTFDASVLEFDFVTTKNVVFFQYVFASEEYNEFVGTGFNDVFAFHINEVGDEANKVNVATLPGTGIPVTIDNVNQVNDEFFVDNDCQLPGCDPILNTEMDGLTVVLPVVAAVEAGKTYHIKMAIADTGDRVLDSNVFIMANSFTDTNAPVSLDDAFETSAGVSGSFYVLANDSDPDGDAIHISSVSQGTNGTTVIEADDTVTYTPNVGYEGVDSFSYEVSDIWGATGTANVSVTVAAEVVNDPPIAVDDVMLAQEDITVGGFDVLFNDSDPNGDTLQVLSITQPLNGVAGINPDSTVSYTPSLNFNGQDSFSYTVSDGNGGEATALVAITVEKLSEKPLVKGTTGKCRTGKESKGKGSGSKKQKC